MKTILALIVSASIATPVVAFACDHDQQNKQTTTNTTDNKKKDDKKKDEPQKKEPVRS
jgi:Ni/Co efflux regulator RcnB